MLSRSELLRMIVDLCSVNDIEILGDPRALPEEICATEDRDIVRNMASIILCLLDDFDYQRSPEFNDLIQGRSAAFVAMKKRIASDAVKRDEQRKRVEKALGDLLANDDAYKLLPKEHHTILSELVGFAQALRNPA